MIKPLLFLIHRVFNTFSGRTDWRFGKFSSMNFICFPRNDEKFDFWPWKWGVDLYSKSTYTRVNTVLNNEKWIYIYTNLLPFLLQYWVVVFLFYRRCHWLQEQLDSPREDNDLWDIFCLLQCRHLWHPLILLRNNCVLFNQIQPLQFASYSLVIEILNVMKCWGHKADTGHWPSSFVCLFPIYGSHSIKFTPPPWPI